MADAGHSIAVAPLYLVMLFCEGFGCCAEGFKRSREEHVSASTSGNVVKGTHSDPDRALLSKLLPGDYLKRHP